MESSNLILIGALVIQGLTVSTQALQPEVLYEFQVGPSYPGGRLVQGTDGNFYGTTSSGGSSGSGTVFKVSTNGEIVMVASFNGTDVAYPQGPLALGNDGNFYGTTPFRGSNDNGTVFRVSPNGALTLLVSFNGTNGSYPSAGLVLSTDGDFYGTTGFGGSGGKGTVFRVTDTGELTTLVSFNGTNGGYPLGLARGGDASFYGTTRDGGTEGFGTLFKVTTNGVLTSLVSFNGTNGREPSALVSGGDGSFYGTTVSGGRTDSGTVFKISAEGELITLLSFNRPNNGNGTVYPSELVFGEDGNLYGTTVFGGTNNTGTFFNVSTSGELTTLISFSNPSSDPNAWNGLALASDGNFYGTTRNGGSSRLGSMFKITAAGELTTLTSFGDLGGSVPTSLVLGQDGNLYGTSMNGGSSGNGTVFKLSTNRVFTTLASLPGADVGSRLNDLLLATDGYLYGATRLQHAIFKVSPDGKLSTLTSFTNTGEFVVSLVMGNEGALYGTTVREGYASVHGGTAFRLTINGELTTLVSFNGTNGAVPNALVFGNDGNLYGMTAGEVGDHVSQGTGTVFKVTTAGDLTTLVSQAWTNNYSQSPFWGKLVLGGDGNFFGTKEMSYPDNNGSVFRLTTNGVLTTLVSFNGTNGAVPRAALVLGSNGDYYGTTSSGGSAGYGTVFRVTPSGELTALVSFNGTNGAYPDAALVFGNDGNLYGTTAGGGSGGGGTIFRIVLPRLKSLVREPGGSFLLTGTGPAKDSYRLWASTDLSSPFAAWTLLTSGSFDRTGNFSFMEASTNHSRFYKLSVP